jgi:dihydrodipicolinate synthase/N-acetylneuraminate lyase
MGVQGVIVLGSLGENTALDPEEKHLVGVAEILAGELPSVPIAGTAPLPIRWVAKHPEADSRWCASSRCRKG